MGDSGRGKSTLADKISESLGVKLYSADDLIWEEKFSKQRTKEESLNMSLDIASLDNWVFEGSSLRLNKCFLEIADLVIYLEHKNFISQSIILYKRFLTRDNETFFNFMTLLKHNLYCRYRLGYKNGSISDLAFLDSNNIEHIRLSSFKEIDDFVSTNT